MNLNWIKSAYPLKSKSPLDESETWKALKRLEKEYDERGRRWRALNQRRALLAPPNDIPPRLIWMQVPPPDMVAQFSHPRLLTHASRD